MSKITKKRAKWVGGHDISIYDLSIVFENGLALTQKQTKSPMNHYFILMTIVFA